MVEKKVTSVVVVGKGENIRKMAKSVPANTILANTILANTIDHI